MDAKKNLSTMCNEAHRVIIGINYLAYVKILVKSSLLVNILIDSMFN